MPVSTVADQVDTFWIELKAAVSRQTPTEKNVESVESAWRTQDFDGSQADNPASQK